MNGFRFRKKMQKTLNFFFSSTPLLTSYTEAINEVSNGTLTMSDGDPGLAGIFATYPANYLSIGGGLGDQVSHFY